MLVQEETHQRYEPVPQRLLSREVALLSAPKDKRLLFIEVSWRQTMEKICQRDVGVNRGNPVLHRMCLLVCKV